MSDTNEGPSPPDDLSDALVEQVDALALPELKSLHSYVERRIDSRRPPLDAAIEAEIEATDAGEVVDVESHGWYALVRKHPPDPDGSGVNTDITSLYHVRREPNLDGTESLRWAYLGDVHTTAETRCVSCGRPLDEDADVCPHCGSAAVDNGRGE